MSSCVGLGCQLRLKHKQEYCSHICFQSGVSSLAPSLNFTLEFLSFTLEFHHLQIQFIGDDRFSHFLTPVADKPSKSNLCATDFPLFSNVSQAQDKTVWVSIHHKQVKWVLNPHFPESLHLTCCKCHCWHTSEAMFEICASALGSPSHSPTGNAHPHPREAAPSVKPKEKCYLELKRASVKLKSTLNIIHPPLK